MATKKFQANVTASGGLGISTLRMFVDYDDTKPFADFLKDVMTSTLMCGYTAILHYNNYLSYAVAAYHGGSEALAKAIMSKVIEYDKTERCLDGLRSVNRAEKEGDKERIDYRVRDYKDNYNVTLEYNEYKKEWQANGCVGYDYYSRNSRELYLWFDGMKTALYHLGFDPEEKETTHRICENLGMYRVQ